MHNGLEYHKCEMRLILLSLKLWFNLNENEFPGILRLECTRKKKTDKKEVNQVSFVLLKYEKEFLRE